MNYNAFFFLPIFFFSLNVFSQDFSIILTTVPKSGTNLVIKLLKKMTGKQNRGAPPDGRTNLSHNISDYKDNRYFYVGHPFADEKEFFSQKFFKGIFVYRDPRDQILSFIDYRKPWSQYINLSYEECFFTFLRQAPGPSWDHLNYREFFESYLPWLDVDNFLAVRFEDLVGPCGGGTLEKQLEVIKRIADHLNIVLPLEQIKNIAGSLFGGTHTFNKGKIGRWRKLFTKDMKQAFKESVGDDIILQFGYNLCQEWFDD